MPEFKQSTPRLKATPMQSNPDVSVGIGEKGGISLYFKGNRFPVTMWENQLRTVLDADIQTELLLFMDEHKDLLAERVSVREGKPETMTTNVADIAIVAKHAEKLAAEGNVAESIKYATLKGVAEANNYKVSPRQLYEIMTLKASLGKL